MKCKQCSGKPIIWIDESHNVEMCVRCNGTGVEPTEDYLELVLELEAVKLKSANRRKALRELNKSYKLMTYDAVENSRYIRARNEMITKQDGRLKALEQKIQKIREFRDKVGARGPSVDMSILTNILNGIYDDH